MIRRVLGGLRTVLLAIAVVCIALVGATTVSALAAAIATGSPRPALGLLGVLGAGLLSVRALWLRALSTTGGEGRVESLPSPEFATEVSGGDALPPVAPTEMESVRGAGGASTDTEWTAREALSGSEQRVYDTLTRTLHDVERELEAATRRLEADEPAAALDRLAETDTALRNAKSRARRHGFASVTRRIGRLWTRYRHIQREAAAVREVSDASARHLSVSDSQLAYDDIERRDRIGGAGTTDLYRATAGTTEIALQEFTVDAAAERVREGIERWERLDGHDHIVRVLGHGSEPWPWIVTEYTDAGHLGERAGDLPFAQAVWTALATAGAVRHAHRRGVAHLRLEPADVRFCSVDGGRVGPPGATGWVRVRCARAVRPRPVRLRREHHRRVPTGCCAVRTVHRSTTVRASHHRHREPPTPTAECGCRRARGTG